MVQGHRIAGIDASLVQRFVVELGDPALDHHPAFGFNLRLVVRIVVVEPGKIFGSGVLVDENTGIDRDRRFGCCGGCSG